MSFTDIFIRRPVLASVVSLLILLVGLASAFNLAVRQFPRITNTTITVTTAYPGVVATSIRHRGYNADTTRMAVIGEPDAQQVRVHQAVLEAGNVVTVEPGVYIPGWGGVRIEDDVAVEAGGARLLTRADRSLRLIHA